MNQYIRIIIPITFILNTHVSHASSTDFKRWAVSAGWLHVMPQGKANPMHINTAVVEGETYGVDRIKNADIVDHATNLDDYRSGFAGIGVAVIESDYNTSPDSYVNSLFTGGMAADVSGISQWTDKAGLEAQDVDTLGLTLSYFPHDKVSLEIVGGIPPTVDIKGKGQIIASSYSEANSSGLLSSLMNGLIIEKDITVANLSNYKKIAEVRAWTPALTAKYHFGKSGKNKFRPYVGAGVVYGYFDKLELNNGLEQKLVDAGHMIRNVLDDKAGDALDNSGTSDGDPKVKVKVSDAFAPVVTLGFTYDISKRFFTTASLTYMPNFNNTATITVTDHNTGERLIKSKTKVDLDPLITYLGVGFRF
ncbi:OmpW/AlkL family protein [Acinetobacter shaoyimingii]|uniref:OmpW family protein n=1 Tax=Acinetobacter shaoyimingii TaxID=2715164 RepID=A0A6G8RUC0_9GAMM|nr:OmpW family protein [Acinetobacter shaoyimingii]QIO05514.1 OmpW family protein [Acinetobacter shaoyimingii]